MPESPSSARVSALYRQLVAEARSETVQLTRRALAELEAEYARLVAVLIEEAVRISSAEAAERLMRRSRAANIALARIRARIVSIEADARRAAQIMGDGHSSAVQLAIQSTAPRVVPSVSFDDIAEDAVEALMRRRQLAIRSGLSATSYSQLFRSVANNATDGVLESLDRTLIQGIARGADSRTVSLDIARQLTDGSPRLRRAVERLAPSLRRSGATLSSRGEALIASDELTEARSLLTRSRRIARTEILSAQLEADRLAQHRSPVVEASRWQLSGAHPPTGCECEVFARVDLYGIGEGAFPTNAVPSRPHPHCGCYLLAITRGADAWDTPKPTAQRPAELASYPFERRADGRAYTPAHQTRIVESVNRQLADAMSAKSSFTELGATGAGVPA